MIYKRQISFLKSHRFSVKLPPIILFEGLIWIGLRKTLIYEGEYPDFGVRDWRRVDFWVGVVICTFDVLKKVTTIRSYQRHLLSIKNAFLNNRIPLRFKAFTFLIHRFAIFTDNFMNNPPFFLSGT